MVEDNSQLPKSITNIKIDGKDIYVVGTAHISKESVEDVRRAVETVKPDSICVELCKGRFDALTQKDNWQKMNIFKIIKG